MQTCQEHLHTLISQYTIIFKLFFLLFVNKSCFNVSFFALQSSHINHVVYVCQDVHTDRLIIENAEK